MQTENTQNNASPSPTIEAPTSTPIQAVSASPIHRGRPKTKNLLFRCILANGVPIGRGRPTKDEMKATKTVVYIPKGQKYDASIYGLGESLDKRKHKSTKSISIN